MKIALICIGRRENQYIREFIDHYKKLGVDKIFLHDNNYDGEEYFEEVIQDYIDNGDVDIIDKRNKSVQQLLSYKECYLNHKNEYDWFIFCDIDEFLEFTQPTDLKTFLNQDKFKNFDVIKINWRIYDDNNLIINENKPLNERFTHPHEPENFIRHLSFPENDHVKSIVRGGLKTINFSNPHTPNTPLKSCDADGKQQLTANPWIHPFNHNTAYFKHYVYKTLQEFLENKSQRGYPDINKNFFKGKNLLKLFYTYNDKTEEKDKYYENFIEENNPNGMVAAMAFGRLGNQMFQAAAAATLAKRTGKTFIGLVNLNDKEDLTKNPMYNGMNIMRNVPYISKEKVKNFKKEPIGKYVCNGFPPSDSKNILLNDYYQDSNCIDKEIAYKLFSPTQEIINEITSLYGDLSKKVCINVRRQDYLNVQKCGFNVLTKETIENIISKYFINDDFFFVSDDINWCKENFKGNKFSFADKKCSCKPQIDLYAQTLCKANIISNSTFSWWGAYLNKNAQKIICQWPWFTKGKINQMKNILPPWFEKYNAYNIEENKTINTTNRRPTKINNNKNRIFFSR